MEILNEIDWSHNKPNPNKFIENEDNFASSSIFRIMSNTFHNPLSEVVDKERKVNVKNDKNNPKNEKKQDNTLNKQKNCLFPDYDKPSPHYIPGLRKLPLYSQVSNLTIEQHRICVKVLRSLNDFCFTMLTVKNKDDNLQFYNNLIPSINAEQKLFMEHVKNIWDTKGCSKHLTMNSDHENMILNIWKKEINKFKYYPRYYEMATLLPLVYSNNEVPIELVLLKSIEDVDSIPELKKLTLNKRYILPVKYTEIENKFNESLNNFNGLSQDLKCEKYAIENHANIVISINGLQTLADNHPPYLQIWNLPILVKEYKTFDDKGNPIIQTITYIDHALPPCNLTEHQKITWFYNLIVKSNFVKNKNDINKNIDTDVCDGCKKFAINFHIIKNDDIPKKEKSRSLSPRISSDSEDEKLVIDISMDCPTSPNRMMTRSSIKTIETKTPSPSNKSPQKDIENNVSPLKKRRVIKKKIYDSNCTCKYKVVEKYYNEENVENLINELLGIINKKNASFKDKQKANDMYKLWKIGQSKEKIKFCKDISSDITILVKSKIDACEINKDGTKQTFVIAPKLEFQWEYGAEIITSSEAVQQWTALKFIPDSKLLRARLLPGSGEICMLEKIPIQSFTGEILKRTSWKPEHGLGCYFNIFSKLSKLHPGQYILRHEPKHHAFALLYSCTEKRCDNGLDLEQIYEKPEEFLINQTAPWIPIDPTVVTPHLNHYNVMPCMFTPGNCRLSKDIHKDEVIHKKKNKNKKGKKGKRIGHFKNNKKMRN